MHADSSRLRVVVHDVASSEAAADTVATDPVPEASDDLPSPGAYIAAQRTRRGMSIEQLAVLTKIPGRSIEMLEADRFEALPGQVFVKGFLRCCARALGVSQQAVMDLLYERERAQNQARRKDKSGDSPAERPEWSESPTPESPVPPSRLRHRGLGESPKAEPGPTPPRSARPPTTRPSLRGRIQGFVPSAHALLWIGVAVLVAVLMLAAFNLAGAPTGLPQS